MTSNNQKKPSAKPRPNQAIQGLKIGFGIVGVMWGFAIGAYLIANRSSDSDKTATSTLKAEKPVESICARRLKDQLKDPASLDVAGFEYLGRLETIPFPAGEVPVPEDRVATGTRVVYRARNSFGAYDTGEALCIRVGAGSSAETAHHVIPR
jgi:hypothetical protein